MKITELTLKMKAISYRISKIFVIHFLIKIGSGWIDKMFWRNFTDLSFPYSR